MPIPKYHEFMLPLLQLAGDRKERTNRESFEAMAMVFRLSADDVALRLPSGRQTILDNRVGWAQTYLRNAGLLESTRRAHFRITDAGLKVLAERPSAIDVTFLNQFPSFVAFRASGSARSADDPTEAGSPTEAATSAKEPPLAQTPEEAISEAAQTLRGQLAAELLERVSRGSPAFFERLVVDLLQAMGYGGASSASGQVTGRSGDGGIDGIITEDRLGLDAVYLQAKRWQANVGRPTVQEFAGAMQGHKADKGVIITTSEFTPEARDYVRTISTRIVLIGGKQLVNLMIDHGVGVRTVETYVIRKVDADYFEDV
jgi:restriction system protein